MNHNPTPLPPLLVPVEQLLEARKDSELLWSALDDIDQLLEPLFSGYRRSASRLDVLRRIIVEMDNSRIALEDESQRRKCLRKMLEDTVVEYNQARKERDEARKERDAARQALELYQSGKVSGNACIPPYVSWAKIADHVATSGAIPRPRFAVPKTADMLHEENKQQMQQTENVLVLCGSYEEFTQYVAGQGAHVVHRATRSAQVLEERAGSAILVRFHCITHPAGLRGVIADRLVFHGTCNNRFSIDDIVYAQRCVRRRPAPTTADAMRAAHVREMEQRQHQREGAD